MPAPYSDDLRQKAIAAVARGERKTDVSRMLSISRNTLDLWLKRQEHQGNCRAIRHYQQGCRHKITDWQRFREFVQQHGDKPQGQMASLWGDNVTQQNISDALRQIGLSRKKRPTAIENGGDLSVLPTAHLGAQAPSVSRAIEEQICQPDRLRG